MGATLKTKWYRVPFKAQLDKETDNLLITSCQEYIKFLKSLFGTAGFPNVITGRLKNSLRYKKLKKGDYAISSTAPYASYLEFGTSKMKPHPFFRPGLTMFMPALRKIWSSYAGKKSALLGR